MRLNREASKVFTTKGVITRINKALPHHDPPPEKLACSKDSREITSYEEYRLFKANPYAELMNRLQLLKSKFRSAQIGLGVLFMCQVLCVCNQACDETCTFGSESKKKNRISRKTPIKRYKYESYRRKLFTSSKFWGIRHQIEWTHANLTAHRSSD